MREMGTDRWSWKVKRSQLLTEDIKQNSVDDGKSYHGNQGNFFSLSRLELRERRHTRCMTESKGTGLTIDGTERGEGLTVEAATTSSLETHCGYRM